MEKLKPEQVTAINKMSTYRLMQKLIQCGKLIGEDEVEKMDRETLKGTWAKFVGEGKENPVIKTDITSYDAQLEREKFEFEKKRWEAELAEKKRLRELEEKRLNQDEKREKQFT